MRQIKLPYENFQRTLRLKRGVQQTGSVTLVWGRSLGYLVLRKTNNCCYQKRADIYSCLTVDRSPA